MGKKVFLCAVGVAIMGLFTLCVIAIVDALEKGNYFLVVVSFTLAALSIAIAAFAVETARGP